MPAERDDQVSKMEEFLRWMKGKEVAVLGIGVSNRPLIGLLCKAGACVTACDKKTREQLGDTACQLEEMGVRLQLGEGYLSNLTQEVIFRSPGIRPDLPSLEQAKAQGSRLTSEMEVFFEVCPCPILAVTGSDGKTTTTTLIAEMLKAEGKRVWLGGNIGQPLLPMAGEMKAEDFAVVELSSFQLMTMSKAPHVAVVTNVTPNHLDVHKGMEEYVSAKEHIFLGQGKGDLLVCNLDNDLSAAMAKKAPGKVRTFSRQEKVESGAFFENDTIYYNGTPWIKKEDIRIPGIHNVENYMAAICAVADYIRPETALQVAREFAGVEHRIEFVREVRGVKYYNDAIATSPARAIAGLHSFDQKLIVIAGGYDKKIPFDAYGEEACHHVKLLILSGATAQKLRQAVENAPSYKDCGIKIAEKATLEEAVQFAWEQAQEGDIVTLSPVCASFDAYPNFMTKGRAYKEMVLRLSE